MRSPIPSHPKSSLSAVTYTHKSRLRQPAILLQDIWQDLLASRELAWQLVYRKINVRYRQSLLGPLWAIIPPILAALTSRVLQKSGVVDISETELPYPLYVMFATVLWQVFSRSLDMPLRAMKEGMSLLRTIQVPVEGLMLAGVGELLFDQGIQLIVLACVFLFAPVSITWGIIPAIGALAMLMLLGISIGLFLVPFGSLYTDVSSALPYVTRFWFFLTPVLYPPPEQPPYSLLVKLNPVTPMLLGVIDLTTTGQLNDPLLFAVVSALTIGLFLVGWVIYRVAVPLLVER